MLLFGSEGFGLKSKTLMHSDFKYKVEMNNNMEKENPNSSPHLRWYGVLDKQPSKDLSF